MGHLTWIGLGGLVFSDFSVFLFEHFLLRFGPVDHNPPAGSNGRAWLEAGSDIVPSIESAG